MRPMSIAMKNTPHRVASSITKRNRWLPSSPDRTPGSNAWLSVFQIALPREMSCAPPIAITSTDRSRTINPVMANSNMTMENVPFESHRSNQY